ncbi:MAG: transposase [Rhodothermales bacterium]|nr:transposase [Rhodothermales bacterium]
MGAFHLDQEITILEEALYPELVPDADIQRLIRIPGIGKIVAFTVMLEIDTIERFESEGQFLSYCRLVPSAKNSGGRTRQQTSKDGNRYLKLAFSHAAVRAIQFYSEIKDFYRGKKRKKPEAIARTLVAKELARIVFYVLKKQENFNGCFKGKPLSRTKALPAVFNRSWPLRASPESQLGLLDPRN